MCPVPCRVSSTLESSWRASPAAPAYGVAGSPVVATTRIGTEEEKKDIAAGVPAYRASWAVRLRGS